MTQALMSGVVTTLTANVPYAVPPGPYRILSTIALTSSSTVGGSYSALTGATAEPGAYISGGFVKAASTAIVVAKKITVQNSYASQIANSGPLSYFRLNESYGSTCYDSIGQNHLAKGSGVTLAGPGPFGNDDYSALFDGSANAECTTSSGVNTWFGASSLSFEGWIFNPAWAVGHEMIVSLGGLGHYLSCDTGKLIMSIHLGSQFTNLALVAMSTSAWHHVAATWTSGEMQRLYVDGAEVAGDDSATPTGTLSSSVNIFVGCFGGSSQFFSGRMAGVAIYLRKLSAAEIAAHYNARNLAA